MASNQEQASYRESEAKGHTQEKTGQVMGAAMDKAYDAKDRAAGHSTGHGQGAAKHKQAGEAAEDKTSATAQAVTDKTSETAQAVKDKQTAGTALAAEDKTVESKDQTGSFLAEKTEMMTKQKADESAEAARHQARPRGSARCAAAQRPCFLGAPTFYTAYIAMQRKKY